MKAHERPATKLCGRCGIDKPVAEFYKSSRNTCKLCWILKCAEYRKNNQTKIKRYLKQWYVRNKDHVLERCHQYNAKPEIKQRERIRQAARYAEQRDAIQASRRQYYDHNPEARQRFLAYQRRYYEGNLHRFAARGSKRRAAKKQAFPKWANRDAIAKFYVLAEQKTRETGIKHVVDHIVPLQGREVCGLHVEFNLQVLTDKQNLEKFNKFG